MFFTLLNPDYCYILEFPVGIDCPKSNEAWIADLNDISSTLLANGTQDLQVESEAESEAFCPVQDWVIVMNANVLQSCTSVIRCCFSWINGVSKYSYPFI